MEGKLTIIAALVILSVLMVPAMLPGARAALPSPENVRTEVQDGAVVVKWSPPSTAVTELRQTGCDPLNRSMSFIYENFTSLYPSIKITLKDGGNAYGFTEWFAGRCEVNQNSRQVNPAEISQAQAKGMTITETKVGVESIAVVTNPQNGIGELTFEQIKGLYTGSILNWKDLGGADLPVKLYTSEQTADAPYAFFNGRATAGMAFSEKAIQVADGIALAGMVANTSGSIGFLNSGLLPRISGVTVLAVRVTSDDPAISPLDLDAVYRGHYELSRYYRLYTNGPMGGELGTWASFILDKDGGQRILLDNGFLPLREADRVTALKNIVNTTDDRILGYRVVREASDGSSVTFEVNGTEYHDITVTAGENFGYSVAALYSTGEGQRSTVIWTMVPAAPSEKLPVSVPPSTATTDGSAIVFLALGLGAIVTVGAMIAYLRRK